MPPRKFAPTPFETTSKSSRQQKQPIEDQSKPRRFAPQVVETTHKSSKDNTGHIRFSQAQDESSRSTATSGSASDQKTVRKFNPVLIDTAKRSYRSPESRNGSVEDYNVETNQRSDSMEDVIMHNEIDSAKRTIPPMEQRRPESPLDGSRPSRLGLMPERQHSFRCPDLDTIESSESERGSAAPSSRSSSPGQGSPNTASDSSFTDFYKHATRIRESVDENFSQYLLQIEAKKAQKKLREQALAAFPNSDFHEPVQHYVNNDGSSDEEIEDRPVTWDGFDEDEIIERIARNRRDSAKTPWEQQELQRHAEKQEQERKAQAGTADQRTQQSAWWMTDSRPDVYHQENEIRSMRDRARPPMLGRDLTFPRCASPQPARFDVTQSAATLRKLCQQSSGPESPVKSNDGGLWCAPPKESPPKPPPCPLDEASNKLGGLWGGFCMEDAEDASSPGLAPPIRQTGLMTPRRDTQVNPFEQSFTGPPVANHTLKTPGTSPAPLASNNLDMNYIDTVLVSDTDLDAQIEREFPDSFVTQVFNYLSLGYPSLARPYDEELAKIARFSIADLRSDDLKAKQDARGYIRLGPDFEPGAGGAEAITEDNCVRWKALKLYIREWARQEKNMVSMDSTGNWGTVARRGSWAI